MLRRLLARSRFLISIAVLGSFLASIMVIVYGGLTVITLMIETFSHSIFSESGSKKLAVSCIQLIDLFLLGAVLYIVALGLYDLFIDDKLPMPSWLIIRDLDDLKGKLIGVVIVLLAVTFLSNVVTWDGNSNILTLGAAIGLVLLGLGYISRNTATH